MDTGNIQDKEGNNNKKDFDNTEENEGNYDKMDDNYNLDICPNSDDNPIEYVLKTRDASGQVVSLVCSLKELRNPIDETAVLLVSSNAVESSQEHERGVSEKESIITDSTSSSGIIVDNDNNDQILLSIDISSFHGGIIV